MAMDFNAIANSMGAMTCVISVEKLPNGEYGEIRLVSGNKAYIDNVENPVDELNLEKRHFIPNSLYTDYLPKDMNFETACYQAAVKKKMIHSYVMPERHDVWINMVFMPLVCDEGNICYCMYTMELDFEADYEAFSKISGDIASEVLETCVVLRSNNDFQKSMNDVVKSIRKMCVAEMCVVLLVDHENHNCRVLGEDRTEATKLKSFRNHLDMGFYDIVSTWKDTIAGSDCLIIKNENDMGYLKEKNLPWYESLKNEGIFSLVLFPLKTGDEVIGYIWADNFDPEKSDRIKETLRITTLILGSEISNYLLLDRMEILSSRDMLTGVLNRNIMNNVVAKLSEKPDKKGDSLGIVFADLNGLKAINDTEGHVAGDNLIKNAADLLVNVFGDDQVYRAGGDEFCVIMTSTSEEEILSKVLKIRELSKEYGNVNFAIGSCVVDDYREIRTALRKADEDMYADKKRFYESNPAMDRRTRTN
ncbi:sensor domain-containing diguanylate cyclase [Butyrivibrio sp. VCD2006]|uniref:sensor domain-containing diguanylate cyclase n=1 Tax=Butyrivibrio sp. VCD2006 TaxID=1280664 RepID=UPI00041EB0CA|nr:sensor domain-containing diguanylate cyclase [Butyrivibrio sp. VCD2006]